MNRIVELFQRKPTQVLSIYFTAGFPNLNDTLPTLRALQEAGVDLVEIGIPFSDPVADGETIQQSSQQALDNGMTLKLLFEQLASFRPQVTMPALLMGYVNPILQYGVEAFCKKCQEIGIDGLILPDLPLEVYQEEYKAIFDQYGLLNIFLITPQTSEERIRQIDSLSQGFVYMVSSASVTGAKTGISEVQEAYFKRIAELNLANPRLVGFGISNHETFLKASQYASGAIVGSAFVKAVQKSGTLDERVKAFVNFLKKEPLEKV